MNEYWDTILESAENTPRALLAAALAEVDEYEAVMVVLQRKSKDDKGNTIEYHTSGEYVTVLGLATYAQHSLLRHLDGFPEEVE